MCHSLNSPLVAKLILQQAVNYRDSGRKAIRSHSKKMRKKRSLDQKISGDICTLEFCPNRLEPHNQNLKTLAVGHYILTIWLFTLCVKKRHFNWLYLPDNTLFFNFKNKQKKRLETHTNMNLVIWIHTQSFCTQKKHNRVNPQLCVRWHFLL